MICVRSWLMIVTAQYEGKICRCLTPRWCRAKWRDAKEPQIFESLAKLVQKKDECFLPHTMRRAKTRVEKTTHCW